MHTRVTIWTVLILTLLPFFGAKAQEQRVPAWPQTRTLAAGASAGITVLLTKAGTATVTLAWKNGPLTATLLSPNNQAIPVPLTASPMRVPITITAADVQKSPVWTLLVAVPGRARLVAPVEVTVNYEGPAVDQAVVQAFVTRMAATRPVLSADIAKRFTAMVQEKIAANQKAQETQIANRNLILSTRLLSSTKRVVSATGIAVNPLLPGALPTTQLRLDSIAPAQPAKLVSVSAALGVPGDVVTLKATDLVPAERWTPDYVKFHTAVWFTINPNLSALASITGVSKAADGATLLQACVPSAAASVVNGYNGTVYIKSDTFSYTTNTLPFRWNPTPKPAITEVTPAQGTASNWVTLKGQNFTATDQVFFVNEGGAEIPAVIRYLSAAALQAQVPTVPQPANAMSAPSGSLPSTRSVNIYVKSSVNNVVVKSNQAVFQLLPPPTIVSLDRANGLPGESLLITGVGFQNPVVHFMQPAGGPDYVARPAVAGNWNASQIYITLPVIPLVPINGLLLNVTVESVGVRSAPKQFTLMPIMEEKVLSEIGWQNFQKQDEADGTSYWENTAHLTRAANGFFDFHNGTDKIAPTVTLQHGWKLERVEVSSNVGFVDYVHGHAYIYPPAVNSTDLTTKIDWWVRCQGAVYCNVSYIIKGPKGVPYK